MQRRRFSREFKIEAVKLVRERGVSEVRSRNDRKRFSCVAIDNGQKPERAAVEQRIRHEVLRPALVHAGDLWPTGAIAPGPLALRCFRPDGEPFFAIQPVGSLVV